MNWKQILADLLTSDGDDRIVRTDGRIRNIQTPKESISDLDDNDHVSKYQVMQVIGGGNDARVLIAAGSAYPAVLTNGTEFTTTKVQPPSFQTVRKGSSHSFTSNGANQLFDWDLNVAEDTLVTLTVYTTTSDGVTVDVDTIVVISQ
jgi:hypothetical protein